MNSLTGKNLITEPLCIDQFLAYISNDHPQANNESVSINDLVTLPLATFKEFLSTNNPAYLNIYEEFSHTYGFSDLESIKRLILSRNAVTILPSLVGAKDIYIESNQVLCKPLKHFNQSIVNYLVYSSQQLSTAELKIIQLIKEVYGNLILENPYLTAAE